MSSRSAVVADCGWVEPEFKAASFILKKVLPCVWPSIKKHRVTKPTWTTLDHLKWYHREQTNGRKGATADGWVYSLARVIHIALHFGTCKNAVANNSIKLENKKRKEMVGGGGLPKKLKREDKVVKQDEFMLAANYMHWTNNLTKSCAKPKDEDGEKIENMAARLDAWDCKLGIVEVLDQMQDKGDSEDGKDADSPRCPVLIGPHTTQDLENQCKCIEAFLTQATQSY